MADKIGEGQGQSAVLLKGRNPVYQPGLKSEGASDIVQDRFCRLLFQLDVTALGCRDEAVLQPVFHTVLRVGKQRSELVLEVILAVGLTDKVQHRHAVLSI